MKIQSIIIIISWLVMVIRENTTNIWLSSTILDPIALAFILGQVLRLISINKKKIKLSIPVEKYLSIGIILMGSQILISKSGIDNIN